MKPSYQGELDGLCGPYAIANAFKECGYPQKKATFKLACEALSKQRWPKVLWEGTAFGDMQRMIKACIKNIDHIKVGYTTPCFCLDKEERLILRSFGNKGQRSIYLH